MTRESEPHQGSLPESNSMSILSQDICALMQIMHNSHFKSFLLMSHGHHSNAGEANFNPIQIRSEQSVIPSSQCYAKSHVGKVILITRSVSLDVKSVAFVHVEDLSRKFR